MDSKNLLFLFIFIVYISANFPLNSKKWIITDNDNNTYKLSKHHIVFISSKDSYIMISNVEWANLNDKTVITYLDKTDELNWECYLVHEDDDVGECIRGFNNYVITRKGSIRSLQDDIIEYKVSEKNWTSVDYSDGVLLITPNSFSEVVISKVEIALNVYPITWLNESFFMFANRDENGIRCEADDDILQCYYKGKIVNFEYTDDINNKAYDVIGEFDVDSCIGVNIRQRILKEKTHKKRVLTDNWKNLIPAMNENAYENYYYSHILDKNEYSINIIDENNNYIKKVYTLDTESDDELTFNLNLDKSGLTTKTASNNCNLNKPYTFVSLRNLQNECLDVANLLFKGNDKLSLKGSIDDGSLRLSINNGEEDDIYLYKTDVNNINTVYNYLSLPTGGIPSDLGAYVKYGNNELGDVTTKFITSIFGVQYYIIADYYHSSYIYSCSSGFTNSGLYSSDNNYYIFNTSSGNFAYVETDGTSKPPYVLFSNVKPVEIMSNIDAKLSAENLFPTIRDNMVKSIITGKPAIETSEDIGSTAKISLLLLLLITLLY